MDRDKATMLKALRAAIAAGADAAGHNVRSVLFSVPGPEAAPDLQVVRAFTDVSFPRELLESHSSRANEDPLGCQALRPAARGSPTFGTGQSTPAIRTTSGAPDSYGVPFASAWRERGGMVESSPFSTQPSAERNCAQTLVLRRLIDRRRMV
jgi:hypothetical protein